MLKKYLGMSYSRWMCSNFYTYWAGYKTFSKEDEQFHCHVSLDTQHSLTYHEVKQLLSNPEKILELKGVDSLAESKELESYMLRFVDDVDNEYEKRQKLSENERNLHDSTVTT